MVLPEGRVSTLAIQSSYIPKVLSVDWKMVLNISWLGFSHHHVTSVLLVATCQDVSSAIEVIMINQDQACILKIVLRASEQALTAVLSVLNQQSGVPE